MTHDGSMNSSNRQEDESSGEEGHLSSVFLSLSREGNRTRKSRPTRLQGFYPPPGWSSSSRGVNRVIPAIPIPSSGQSPTFPCSLARVAIHPGEEKKIKQHSSIWNFFSREKGNNCGGQKEENEQTGEERTRREGWARMIEAKMILISSQTAIFEVRVKQWIGFNSGRRDSSERTLKFGPAITVYN